MAILIIRCVQRDVILFGRVLTAGADSVVYVLTAFCFAAL